MLGDLQLFLGATAVSDLYFLKDPVSMYRCGGGGLMTYPLSSSRVRRDGMLVTLYFARSVLGFNACDLPTYQLDDLISCSLRVLNLIGKDSQSISDYWTRLLSLPEMGFIRHMSRYATLDKLLTNGRSNRIVNDIGFWKRLQFVKGSKISARLKEYYFETAKEEFMGYYGGNTTILHRTHEWVRGWYHFISSWLHHA